MAEEKKFVLRGVLAVGEADDGFFIIGLGCEMKFCCGGVVAV